eukprot:gnl/TRDRNA2_/TRDRNA2_185046_c0_seq1.p1 gnl/TRDRNA2_/TRDRNA2_185046_c0~~gnl/TRDRNA2_/TRDRNA2_185046_c0_seq1.p1  ORF type:complete len:354 (+),score=48.83 gnl/TRDRNA2_/TRDRNA2_185046_c0_seq1:93-1154(+)
MHVPLLARAPVTLLASCIATLLSPSAGAGASVKVSSTNGTSTSSTGNCWNPLFQTHWAGKSDIRHLLSEPAPQYDLNLCPFYNGRRACCTPSFEDALEKGFKRWVKHFQRKANHLRDFQMELTKVRVSPEYVDAVDAEQALLDKALASFRNGLDLYGTCFDTLLEYLAGVLCFSCDPQWQSKVFMDVEGVRVGHLHVHDSSNDDLWESCRGFGAAAKEMQTRAADSALAKTIRLPFFDYSMFATKIGVAEYMLGLGLFPLRGPSEHMLSIENNAKAPERLLAAAAPSLSSGIGPINNTIYPVRDGRLSGFHCKVFPRQPLGLGLGAGRRSAGLRLSLIAAVLVASVASACGII